MACCETEVGTGQYHCAGCCRTFGNLTLFDDHQRLRRGAITCKDPRRMGGLVQDRWGTWRTPEERAAVEARVDKMKEARRK